MSTPVKTVMKETGPTSLKADIYYSYDDGSYMVSYFVNGENVKTETHHLQNIQMVEASVQDWFMNLKVLNS